jgi:hypothetical protein
MARIVSMPSGAGVGTPTRRSPHRPSLAGPPPVPGRISVRRVIEETAEHFGTTPDDIVSTCQTRPADPRRQVAMYLAHKVTGRSLVFIGRHMGGRHYTTIRHGVQTVQGLLDAGDAEAAAAVGAIRERLQVTTRKPSAPITRNGQPDRPLRAGRT